MKTLHQIIQKAAVFFFVLTFVFVSIYTPQPFNKTKASEAWFASEATQVLNNLELLLIDAATTAETAFSAISNNKEMILDGLAWMIAKQIVSAMTASIVDWINNGFEGSPAFVQDLDGFLLDVADDTVGLFLEELGGPLSFICSPFKLDVQISIALAYENQRNTGHIAGSCTLTGALENIEDFLGGSFKDGGGWDAWFEITNKPEMYTPYGQALAAKAQLDINLLNAKNREVKVLEFGKGFLSKKECTDVEGDDEYGPPAQTCKIVTPGEVISNSLNKHLGTGVDALIGADEFNEIIGALISQLAQKVITGAGGLLGVSTASASGGGQGSSYIDQLIGESFNTDSLSENVTESIEKEERYQREANRYYPRLVTFSNNLSYPASRREVARDKAAEINNDLLPEIRSNITALNDILTRLNATTDSEVIGQLTRQYTNLPLHTDSAIDGAIRVWEAVLEEPEDPEGSPGG